MSVPTFPGTGVRRLVVERIGATLTVDVPDGVLASSLLRAFPWIRTAALDSGVERVTPADLSVVADGRGFILTSMRDRGEERFRDVSETLVEVEHAVCLFSLGREPDSAHLHASGAVLPSGRAILAVGPTGAGKSTMALAWCAAGWPLLGDDVVLVREGARVMPFPRLPKVDERRLAAVDWMEDAELTPYTLGREARFDPMAGSGWAGTGARVALVAFLRRNEVGRPEVTELPAGLSLRRLMESLHASGLPASAAFGALADLVEAATCVEVEYSDAVEAASMLVDRVR